MSEKNQTNASELAERNDELAALAQRAKEAHLRVADSLAQAVADALEVGGALLRAKEICPEGKFTAWLRENFPYSLTTARGYMRLVANWNTLAPDQRRAVGLSQRQLRNLLKGLPCADGRENPHARRLAAPRDAAAGPGAGADATPPVAASASGADDDDLATVDRLLGQVVAELRRLAGGGERGTYAGHLLQMLEYVHQGLPSRAWFWNMMPDRS